MTFGTTIDARATVLYSARHEARRRGATLVGTDHLLLGLLADPRGLASRVLGLDLEEARDGLRRLDQAALDSIGLAQPPAPRDTSGDAPPLPLTDGAKQALLRAVHEARAAGARFVSGRHLLVGLVDATPPDPLVELVRELGLDIVALRRAVRAATDD